MRAQEKQRLMKANQQLSVVKFQTRKLFQQAKNLRDRALVKDALNLVEGIKQVVNGFAGQ